jgi:hypothetical protein
MAFDGSTSTKWYDGVTPPGWLQYYLGGVSKTVVGYSLTSANDVPQRDPRNWQLQGSQNGTAWSVLDTQTSQTFTARFQTIQYGINTTTAYKYYRLYITANSGGSGYGIQLSEFALTFSPPPIVSTIAPQLGLLTGNGQIQIKWPADHMGWLLEAQANTNGSASGWVAISNSIATNQISIPINVTNRSTFFRLVYP